MQRLRSYARVAAFARDWKRQRQYEQQTSGRGTFVPLAFQPGEAFQFDWSEDYALVAGKQTKLQVAHTKLAHSRAFIVRAYPLQTHEMLFDALTQAFRVLGGVPRRGIFDNMKTAVDRIGTGKARQVNARFAALASHYLFETDFCNPTSGWDKGQVEKSVQDARRRLWQPMPSFPDIYALNAWLEVQCVAQWAEIQHGVLPGTVADVHAAEVGSLMPMGRPFDGFVEQTKRVSPTCLIAFERNRYSVPASFANRPVSLRVYPDRLAVAAEGNIVCEHARIIDRSHHKPGRTIYDWRHYLAVVQRKPGALRNGAPFLEMPEAFRQLQGHLLKRIGGDREMVEILSLVLHHDEQVVLQAVELALEAGVATKTHVLNVLHQLIDGKAPPTPPIDAPQALSLVQEPVADVDRYDTLREMRGNVAAAGLLVHLKEAMDRIASRSGAVRNEAGHLIGTVHCKRGKARVRVCRSEREVRQQNAGRQRLWQFGIGRRANGMGRIFVRRQRTDILHDFRIIGSGRAIGVDKLL